MKKGKTKSREKRNEVMEALRTYRRAKGLTLQQVASRLGCKRAAVSGWECGRFNPSSVRIPKIAKLYGKAPEHIAALCAGHVDTGSHGAMASDL